METINLEKKYSLFNDHWHPRIIAELNGQQVKIAKVLGEFVWHDHEKEDELFFVVKGEIKIEFRDSTKIVREGEMLVVPRGIEHRPFAENEALILLFEPASTLHTGNVKSELTRNENDWI